MSPTVELQTRHQYLSPISRGFIQQNEMIDPDILRRPGFRIGKDSAKSTLEKHGDYLSGSEDDQRQDGSVYRGLYRSPHNTRPERQLLPASSDE